VGRKRDHIRCYPCRAGRGLPELSSKLGDLGIKVRQGADLSRLHGPILGGPKLAVSKAPTGPCFIRCSTSKAQDQAVDGQSNAGLLALLAEVRGPVQSAQFGGSALRESGVAASIVEIGSARGRVRPVGNVQYAENLQGGRMLAGASGFAVIGITWRVTSDFSDRSGGKI
jgi:hypothetical protein